MRSHTVPKKLLEQFAYYHPKKRSLWLWRYETGRPPTPNASPKSATRIQKHFSHPDDTSKEAQIERRLNDEFETPVKEFLFKITQPGFVATALQRRQLAFYVTLLFMRSEARRNASAHTQELIRRSIESFLSNKDQILTVATCWNIEVINQGSDPLFTVDQVIQWAREARYQTTLGIQEQRSYLNMIEGNMQTVDEPLMRGEWRYLRTTPDRPFVISDAPVATWVRSEQNTLSYGQGFHRANVEVFLPISPLTCLHILPDVERTRGVLQPSVEDINAAQAAFATRYCFTNINSQEIDRMFQESFGKAEIGKKSFTLWHRNYTDTYYELLLNGRTALD
jgi:hypothetical protein